MNGSMPPPIDHKEPRHDRHDRDDLEAERPTRVELPGLDLPAIASKYTALRLATIRKRSLR
jgi:hypothetical protein